jgi:hypothetical protein
MPFPSRFDGSTMDQAARALARVVDTASGRLDFSASAPDRAAQARAARQWLPLPVADRRGPDLPRTSLEHDAYFEVRRCTGDTATLFVRALVLAHLEAPLDCVTQHPSDWDDSPAALFEGMRTLYRAAGIAQPPTVASPDPGWSPEPMQTWLAGHRLFFAVIEGAVIGLRHALSHVGDPVELTRGLEFSSTFLRSSAAAMRLASAFDPQLYIDDVRPDMAPPKVSAGFSGLYTVDHKALVKAMTDWRMVAAQLPDTPASEGFVESVDLVYRSHEFVCARFRGDEVPSLLTEATSDGSVLPVSGVALAREFTRRRVHSLRKSTAGGRAAIDRA